MSTTNVGVSPSLQKAYDEQYTDEMTEWRRLGAKYKADNIVHVSSGLSFRTVLECGAGEGSILEFLDKKQFADELSALEISDSGIHQIRKRKLARVRDVQKFDGYHIPYADLEFDLVYCSHVLEHVEHPRLLLREIKRVARHQIFEVPLDYSPTIDTRTDALMQLGHINIFTPSTFKFLLRSEGFHIERELLTHTATDVLRYNLYHNARLKRTLLREARLFANPLLKFVKRYIIGATFNGDYGYSAYTCLTSARADLTVLSNHPALP